MTVKQLSERIAKRIPVKWCGTLFEPTALIKRFSEENMCFFYQAEILDTKNKNSVLIVKIDDVE